MCPALGIRSHTPESRFLLPASSLQVALDPRSRILDPITLDGFGETRSDHGKLDHSNFSTLPTDEQTSSFWDRDGFSHGAFCWLGADG